MFVTFLHKALKPVLFCGKFCRLVCFNFTTSKYRISTVQIYINFILALICLVSCGYEVQHHLSTTKIPKMFKTIGITEVIAMATVIVAAWTSISCYQRKYIRFIKEIARLDRRFLKIGTKIGYEKIKKTALVHCTVRLVILTGAIGVHLYMGLNRHTYVDNTLCYVAFVINSSICLQVTIFAIIIKERFAVLNRLLHDINDIQSNNNGQGYFKVIDDVVAHTLIGLDLYFLKFITRMHQDLSNVVEYINKIFGVSLLVLFLNGFQTPLFALYYTNCVMSNFDSLQVPAVTQLMIVSFMFSLDFAYVFHCCNSTCEEGRKAGLIIYQIQNEDETLSREIDMFSLQMVHNKIEFNAAGLFPINYGSVFSMISAFTMNLIILVQFSTEKQNKLCLEVPLESYA